MTKPGINEKKRIERKLKIDEEKKKDLIDILSKQYGIRRVIVTDMVSVIGLDATKISLKFLEQGSYSKKELVDFYYDMIQPTKYLMNKKGATENEAYRLADKHRTNVFKEDFDADYELQMIRNQDFIEDDYSHIEAALCDGCIENLEDEKNLSETDSDLETIMHVIGLQEIAVSQLAASPRKKLDNDLGYCHNPEFTGIGSDEVDYALTKQDQSQ